MEQDYSSIVAKYSCPYVNGFGSSEMQYSTSTKEKSSGSSVKVKYTTVGISSLAEAEKIEDKC